MALLVSCNRAGLIPFKFKFIVISHYLAPLQFSALPYLGSFKLIGVRADVRQIGPAAGA